MTPKERAIPFSGEEVQATLAGRKTQTRRPIKNPDFMGCTTGDCPHEKQTECNVVLASQCPYPVGMRLWVCETWGEVSHIDWGDPRKASFVHVLGLDERCIIYREEALRHGFEWAGESDADRWRPSIHMPRWASRLTLLVTDVLVQRVQEIRTNEHDLRAEGLELRPSELYPEINTASKLCRQFESLWEQTYGPGAWERNDWVWAIGFEVVK